MSDAIEVFMLRGRDLIVFSDDWGRHPFSCQHIMKHFLPYNRLLWVNTIGMRNPRLSLYDLKRGIEKIKSFSEATATVALPHNLTVINPFMLPFGNRFVRELNRNSVVKSVRDSMGKLNFCKPIVLTTLPNAADYLGAFGEILSVYYCVDEFSEWPGVNTHLVRIMERKLLNQVDLVVAVSDALCQSKHPANNSKVLLLTHGVDVEHFRKASTRFTGMDVQVIMGHIKSPIIGYFGLFDKRSDQDILETILVRHPDWSVVVIGKSQVCLDRLSIYQNFYLVDPVSYDELPAYVSFFQVCILPYVRSTLTDNINPLKLKEYLATGKPVVATALPEVVKLQPWVTIAENPDDFVLKIENVMQSAPPETKALASLLGPESWQAKAEQLSVWIEETLVTSKSSTS